MRNTQLLTVNDYKEFREIGSKSLTEQQRREIRERLGKKYNLTKKEVENVFQKSKKLLPPPEDWV